jgi:hypothetical protein
MPETWRFLDPGEKRELAEAISQLHDGVTVVIESLSGYARVKSPGSRIATFYTVEQARAIKERDE